MTYFSYQLVTSLSPIWFEIFIIFIIEPNPISANNNPKLQDLFKKSEVASKRTTFSIVGKSSILDLMEFLDLPQLIYIATTLHYFSQPTGLQEKHDTAYKSSLNRHKVWRTQGD